LRAWLNTRFADGVRIEALKKGFERLGFKVVHGLTSSPAAGDVLCTWNRIHQGETAARAFEAAGRPVLVVENAAWGNDFLGGRWLSLARSMHNTSGMFPEGGPERWDALNFELAKFRNSGETVILPQRGIGPAGVAMPRGWHSGKVGRVRLHPGTHAARSLEEDLKNAGRVITWGSGAAVKALMWGIPVESHMPNWIGEQDNTDAGRLAMFRRLAWAQWRLDELASGEPMKRLLG
jgi:hypothetical protein